MGVASGDTRGPGGRRRQDASRRGHQVEWVTDDARLVALESSWARLARDAAPFYDHAWFVAWRRAFAAAAPLRVCAIWSQDRLVAAMPMIADGRGLAAMANPHTPFFAPLARSDRDLRHLVTAVLDAPASHLRIDALPASHPVLSVLGACSSRRARPVLVEPSYSSPIVETTGDWATYRRSRGSRLKGLMRERRVLERDHAVRFTVDHGAGDLETALQNGLELERSGWKGRAGTGVLDRDETTEFYHSFARAYRDQGELRLAWLHVDGRPAAFNLCIERNRRLYLLKTGYEESLRRLSPGLILNLLLVERCFENGSEAYELLGDETPWKQVFATTRRAHVRAWSHRPAPIPLAHHLFRRAGRPLLLEARRHLNARKLPRRASRP